MSDMAHWGACSKWHHRLLGGTWALGGLLALGNAAVRGGWREPQFWIVCPVALLYVVAGAGFVFGERSARWTMGVLMVFAGLFFLDMLLMFGFHANRAGMLGALAALGVVVYTLGFLLISAARHSQGSA